MELSNEIKYYIGHAIDADTRFKASSGGIGTAITKYLLSQPEYETSITFFFDSEKSMYVPKIIYSSEEINVCGSVYHDIDIPRFLRDNIGRIKGGVVVTCAPCHVALVRQLLTRKNHLCFIISYCCSGQTTIEGTWKYYDLLGIRKEKVVNMQYRGNGWPSGIQIWLKDGRKICKENYTEPWTTLHRSKLYTPKRCFFCKRDTGRNADVALADPWLKHYLDEDQIGNTMFIPFTQKGKAILEQMSKENLIAYSLSSYDEYSIAQAPNIRKEILVQTQRNFINNQLYFLSKDWYFKFASKSVDSMRLHIKFMKYLYKFFSKKNFAASIKNITCKVQKRIRFYNIKTKLGKSKGYISINGGGNNE